MSDVVVIDKNTNSNIWRWIPGCLTNLSEYLMRKSGIDYSDARILSRDIIYGYTEPSCIDKCMFSDHIEAPYPHVYDKELYDAAFKCVQEAMRIISNNPIVDEILGITRYGG